MKTALVTILLTLAASAETIRGTVDDIHDGDTVRIRTTNGLVRVRMESIDAPELKQPGGIVSRDTLRRLAPLHQLVTVEVTGQDKYYRTLGEVYYQGKNLNLTMVRTGQAWCYRKYCKNPTYYEAERQAQAKHLGVWAESNPMAPWVFRHLPKTITVK